MTSSCRHLTAKPINCLIIAARAFMPSPVAALVVRPGAPVVP